MAKRQAQPHNKHQEPKQPAPAGKRPAATARAQLAAGLAHNAPLATLPSHPSNRALRQAAVLQMQRQAGNGGVRRLLEQPAAIQRRGTPLSNPYIVVRPASLTWYNGEAPIRENSPTRYTAYVGCLPGGRTISYTTAGQVFIRSRDTGDEIPYTRANHRDHFPSRPYLNEVGINTNVHYDPAIRFSTNEVANLRADGRYRTEFNMTKLDHPVRYLDVGLSLTDARSTDAAGSHLRLQSIQGADELLAVCEDALGADQAREQASARAEQLGQQTEPLLMGPPSGAIPHPAGELDRINYYLGAVGLRIDSHGFMQMQPRWTAPDRWRWIARNFLWNESLSPGSALWNARYVYETLRNYRDAYLDANRPPLAFSVFIGELRRYEDEHPGATIDDVIQALRRAGHEKELPFDQVIGVPEGKHEEYLTGGVGGPMQFLKDHNRVSVAGRVVDMYHLAVGLEALPRDYANVTLETPINYPLGQIIIVQETEMESAAAATWAGDVGSALADWMMGVDTRGEPPGSMEDKLDYYWQTRASQADLDGDIEAWGIDRSRDELPPNLRRLSDILLYHYGGSRVAENRRNAYQVFADYYRESGSRMLDISRLRTQIVEFSRIWMMKRLRDGFGIRYSMAEYEWAADELTSKLMIHVEDHL